MRSHLLSSSYSSSSSRKQTHSLGSVRDSPNIPFHFFFCHWLLPHREPRGGSCLNQQNVSLWLCHCEMGASHSFLLGQLWLASISRFPFFPRRRCRHGKEGEIASREGKESAAIAAEEKGGEKRKLHSHIPGQSEPWKFKKISDSRFLRVPLAATE